MIFSKSFGYALRGILYIAIMKEQKRYVQVEEIASKLAAPRHFMGKIMKRLAKEKLLISAKGPSGGFMLGENTLEKPLMDLIVITDEIYGELSHDQSHVSLTSLPHMRDRCLLLHGFSKAWSMTLVG